jgi:hypothetical protein
VHPTFSTPAWRALAPLVAALAMLEDTRAVKAKAAWPDSEGSRRPVRALSFSILLDYPLIPEH